MRLNYPNDVWEMSANVEAVQRNYDPAIGFTPRNDYRRYNPRIRWNPRPQTRHSFIRRFGFGADPFFLTDMRNRMESAGGNLQLFRLEMHSGDTFEFNVSPGYERLRDDFEIAEGVVLRCGRASSGARSSPDRGASTRSNWTSGRGEVSA